LTQTNSSTSQQNGHESKAEAPKVPALSLEEGYAYFEGNFVLMPFNMVLPALKVYVATGMTLTSNSTC